MRHPIAKTYLAFSLGLTLAGLVGIAANNSTVSKLEKLPSVAKCREAESRLDASWKTFSETNFAYRASELIGSPERLERDRAVAREYRDNYYKAIEKYKSALDEDTSVILKKIDKRDRLSNLFLVGFLIGAFNSLISGICNYGYSLERK